MVWFSTLSIGAFSCCPYVTAMHIRFFVFSLIHFVSACSLGPSSSSSMLNMSVLIRNLMPPPTDSPLVRCVSVIPAMWVPSACRVVSMLSILLFNPLTLIMGILWFWSGHRRCRIRRRIRRRIHRRIRRRIHRRMPRLVFHLTVTPMHVSNSYMTQPL